MMAPLEGPSDDPPRRRKRALTDVFDEERQEVVVQYPPRFVGWLTTFGILALIITALVGYPRTDDLTNQTTLPATALWILDKLFGKPWLLFVFFGALIVTLQGSVLRASALRRYQRSAYITTAVSMALVSVLYLYHSSIGQLLNDLLSALQTVFGQFSSAFASALKEAPSNPWTYLAINIVLLGIIFGQAVPGWIRRALKNPSPRAPIDLHSGQPVPLRADEQSASVLDLIAGDLLVRPIFTILLALLFWFPVISRLVHGFFGIPIAPNDLQPTQHHVFSICSASLPGTCFVGFAWELWVLDILVAIFALAAGLLMLAIRIQAEFMAQRNINRGQEMLNAVMDIILSPFDRNPRSRFGLRVHGSLQASLSPLLWRPLVFVGVVGAAGLADFTQRAIQCPKFYDSRPLDKFISAHCELHPLGNGALSYIVNDAAPILGFGLLAIAGSVLSLAVMFARGHIVSNTSRFLQWIAGSNALPLGLFLGALVLVNFGSLLLAHLIDAARHQGQAVLWQSWLGFGTPPRLHPFYPGLLSLVLAGGLLAYFGGVVPLRKFMRKAQ